MSEYGISIMDQDRNELTYGDLVGINTSNYHTQIDANADNFVAPTENVEGMAAPESNVEFEAELLDASELADDNESQQESVEVDK